MTYEEAKQHPLWDAFHSGSGAPYLDGDDDVDRSAWNGGDEELFEQFVRGYECCKELLKKYMAIVGYEEGFDFLRPPAHEVKMADVVVTKEDYQALLIIAGWTPEGEIAYVESQKRFREAYGSNKTGG